MNTRHNVADTTRAEGYTRLFSKRQPRVDRSAALRLVSEAMGRNRRNLDVSKKIRIGYTYLGQFLTHETTFLPAFDAVDRQLMPSNRRTAILDLDSLYGVVPRDPSRYEGNLLSSFRLGRNLSERRIWSGRLASYDVPRESGQALIPDPRNDENAIVVQLHALFMRFHNAVVAKLSDCVKEDELFACARAVVARHFQAIVLTDFLPTVCDEEIANGYLKSKLQFGLDMSGLRSGPRIPARMPLEIASAAFRLHPLVKGRYTLSNDEDSALIQSLLRPEPKQPLLPHQAVDWNLFFGPDDARKFAARLEPKLAAPLVELPAKDGNGSFNLAHQTLLRGDRLGLPSGQVVADSLEKRGLVAPGHLAGQIRDNLPGGSPTTRDLVDDTPLWLYLMIEAKVRKDGDCLGEIGVPSTVRHVHVSGALDTRVDPGSRGPGP